MSSETQSSTEKMKFLLEDCVSIWSNIQHQEEQRKSKMRWLMGLSKASRSNTKRLKKPEFLKDVYMPESLLREDDVSYEIVRTSIERGFGISSAERESYVVQDYMHLLDTDTSLSEVATVLPSILDKMTNTGLSNLANIASGGSVAFEKTRLKMKMIIKEYLNEKLSNPNQEDHMRFLTALEQLLKDPGNFRETHVKLVDPVLDSHYHAATKLLEGLEDMSTETLYAMRRKLNGILDYTPQLRHAKSGWNRSRLVGFVKRKCFSFLSKIKEGDELQNPLAKAMAVAVLSLKLKKKKSDITLPEFCCFSPEIEALQNEILKAIWHLKYKKTTNLEMKELENLLDPKAEISKLHFRPAVQKMLIEYLFECGDMAVVPNLLLETIAIITRSSSLNVEARHFSKEEVEEEVESVLCVSSQMKQIVWDCISDQNIDEEFSDAYLDDMLESDEYDGDGGGDKYNYDSFKNNNDDYDDHQLEYRIGTSIDNDDESIGDYSPTSDGNGSLLPLMFDRSLMINSPEESKPEQITGPGPGDPYELGSSNPSCQDMLVSYEPQATCSNKYLAIQEICDETSLVAHRLIGHLMDEFLHIEGVDLKESKRSYLRGGLSSPKDCSDDEEMQTSEVDMGGSVLVKVVEEILPSFPKSGIRRIKEFMGQTS